MTDNDIRNVISCLLIIGIISLVFLLICVYYTLTEDYSLMPEAYKVTSVVSLVSWLSALGIMFIAEFEGSIIIRILITLLSIAVVVITFFSTQILFSPLCYLLIAILLANYFLYLLEFMGQR